MANVHHLHQLRKNGCLGLYVVCYYSRPLFLHMLWCHTLLLYFYVVGNGHYASIKLYFFLKAIVNRTGVPGYSGRAGGAGSIAYLSSQCGGNRPGMVSWDSDDSSLSVSMESHRHLAASAQNLLKEGMKIRILYVLTLSQRHHHIRPLLKELHCLPMTY